MQGSREKPKNPHSSDIECGFLLSQKICKKCGESNRGKPRKSSPHGDCKTCDRIGASVLVLKYKERRILLNSLWHKKNAIKVRARVSEYRKKNKEKCNEAVRASALKRAKRVPNWIDADERWLIKEIYSLAVLRSKALGFSWHVDHILPLQGKLVSGLHVPFNLQVIPAVENLRKGNRL